MPRSLVRVLVVEDSKPFQRFISSKLQIRQDMQVAGEVGDGLTAVQKAKELQPDLVLLDIGLPKLNGLETARRICKVSPKSKIVFVSQEASGDIVQEAFNLGASGYVVKMDAEKELLTAVDAVLRGEQFVSARFAGHDFTGVSKPVADEATLESLRGKTVFTPPFQDKGVARRHEAGFYSGDDSFLGEFTRFIVNALTAGKAVIVIATESHRNRLLLRFRVHGLDIDAAIEKGRYIPLDAPEVLSTFMVNGVLDPVRFQKVAGDLIVETSKSVNGETARIAACGECAPLLWVQGNMEAAIRLEHLWDELAITHKLDVLCGYSLNSFQGGMGSYAFEKICSAHSAIHSR